MALLFTKDELNHAFKVWLSEYLHDNNLTYQEAANRLNMSIASIGHILNGRRKASLDLVAKSMAQAGLDYNKELRHLVPGLHLANLPETADNYEEANFLSSGDMAARGFFTVPFSSRMKLAAGGGGTIPVSEEADESSIVVHGPSIKRHSAKNLQAFRLGRDSMEPLIA